MTSALFYAANPSVPAECGSWRSHPLWGGGYTLLPNHLLQAAPVRGACPTSSPKAVIFCGRMPLGMYGRFVKVKPKSSVRSFATQIIARSLVWTVRDD